MLTLKQLLTNVTSESFIPPTESQGLCGLIRDNCSGHDSVIFRAHMANWPRAYPSKICPVEGCIDKYRASKAADTLWENPRRYQLAQYVLNCIVYVEIHNKLEGQPREVIVSYLHNQHRISDVRNVLADVGLFVNTCGEDYVEVSLDIDQASQCVTVTK